MNGASYDNKGPTLLGSAGKMSSYGRDIIRQNPDQPGPDPTSHILVREAPRGPVTVTNRTSVETESKALAATKQSERNKQGELIRHAWQG